MKIFQKYQIVLFQLLYLEGKEPIYYIDRALLILENWMISTLVLILSFKTLQYIER